MNCPFRKFHPAWIRIIRQNYRIIESVQSDDAPTAQRQLAGMSEAEIAELRKQAEEAVARVMREKPNPELVARARDRVENGRT